MTVFVDAIFCPKGATHSAHTAGRADPGPSLPVPEAPWPAKSRQAAPTLISSFQECFMVSVVSIVGGDQHAVHRGKAECSPGYCVVRLS